MDEDTENKRSIKNWEGMKDWRFKKIEDLQKEIDFINKRIKEIESSQNN